VRGIAGGIAAAAIALIAAAFTLAFLDRGLLPATLTTWDVADISQMLVGAVDVAVICLEAALAIAVLKYRLYDIDIVISKALQYGALAAFITAVLRPGATAGDEARRRLERNLHDGAQQDLVALAIKLKIAGGTLSDGAEEARHLFEELQADTRDRAAEPAGPGAWHLPAIAGRPGPGGRAQRAGEEVRAAGDDPGRRPGPVP